VDVVELLQGEAPFIADTSAWLRFSSLPDELAGLIKAAVADERLWTTPIVRMEILYSARGTSEYIALETELDALRILRNDRAVADAAMSAIGELAEHSDGYHRVPLTDALIAAAAAEHGGICGAPSRHALQQARRSPHVRERRASGILTRRLHCPEEHPQRELPTTPPSRPTQACRVYEARAPGPAAAWSSTGGSSASTGVLGRSRK